MTLEQEIGKTILELRKKQKKTQEKLAKASKHNRTYIGAVERGEKSITVRSLLHISRGLGIPLIELLSKIEYNGVASIPKPPTEIKK